MPLTGSPSTQFGVAGGPAMPFGEFVHALEAGDHDPGAITMLGVSGFPGLIYGAFTHPPAMTDRIVLFAGRPSVTRSLSGFSSVRPTLAGSASVRLEQE